MQNFSKLYRKIKTQTSEKVRPEYKIKVQLIQKQSDLNLSNVAINGNKLFIKNTHKSFNAAACMQNQAIKSFTSFTSHQKIINKNRNQQVPAIKQNSHFSMSQTSNFLSSSFQIGKLQQILRNSQSLKKDQIASLKIQQKHSLQRKNHIKTFSKYRNKLIRSKNKKSSNLLQDSFEQNISIHVGLHSNTQVHKIAIQSNNKLSDQYRKLQEIKKIVQKIELKNKQYKIQTANSLQNIQTKYKNSINHTKNNNVPLKKFSNAAIKNSISFAKQIEKNKHKLKIDINDLQPWEFD